MPAEMPYMNTSGNIPNILEKIKSAGAPPKFTHEFLKSNLGFTSSNDRGIVQVLKALAFLDASGTPAPRYHEFRDSSKSGRAMAAGLREGWAPVFLSDEAACSRTAEQLKAIFQSVTGKSESVAKKMASTFKALCAVADFSDPSGTATTVHEENQPAESFENKAASDGRVLALHQDVHVHLPPTTDVAVYTAIFRAMKDELLD
jgi:Family of unknown function (DUF5343)